MLPNCPGEGSGEVSAGELAKETGPRKVAGKSNLGQRNSGKKVQTCLAKRVTAGHFLFQRPERPTETMT